MLKTYEDYNNIKSKIELEDYVKCVDASCSDSILVNGNIYKIDNMKLTSYDRQFEVEGYMWYEDRFVLSTPEEFNEQKLKNTANKYNL